MAVPKNSFSRKDDFVKVVARFTDNRVIHGFTKDFFPAKTAFHIYPSKTGDRQEAIPVSLRELKALFFVSDFDGDPKYEERKHFYEDDQPSGRRVEVTFMDGEVLVGSTLGYEPTRPGFFLFPADPQSNNLSVFVLAHGVKNVRDC